jgi:uncharacterized membrane protein YhaH (DUF805 family)
MNPESTTIDKEPRSLTAAEFLGSLKHPIGRIAYAKGVGITAVGFTLSVYLFAFLPASVPVLVGLFTALISSMWVWIALTGRRLHDMNQSALWMLFLLILPPVAIIVITLTGLCAARVERRNRYR